MSLDRKHFGRAGENAAIKFVKKLGYRVLQKNYRTSLGEIDLIALHDDTVVFIEVKSRSDDEFGDPALAVTPKKQKTLGAVARCFLAEKKIVDRDCRFDVVTVTGTPDKPETWTLEIIENAFMV